MVGPSWATSLSALLKWLLQPRAKLNISFRGLWSLENHPSNLIPIKSARTPLTSIYLLGWSLRHQQGHKSKAPSKIEQVAGLLISAGQRQFQQRGQTNRWTVGLTKTKLIVWAYIWGSRTRPPRTNTSWDDYEYSDSWFLCLILGNWQSCLFGPQIYTDSTYGGCEVLRAPKRMHSFCQLAMSNQFKMFAYQIIFILWLLYFKYYNYKIPYSICWELAMIPTTGGRLLPSIEE
jgi:hypothetical protein